MSTIETGLSKEAEEVRDDFLSAMSNVANSVTVVTTDGSGGRFGATVSSFCSVSADPPQVLVCLNHSGQTANAVVENGVFCVNVLPESGSELAMIFAGQTTTDELEKFSDPKWKKEQFTSPLLEDVTAFQCTVKETVSSTSHFIIIGEVVKVVEGNAPPLIYLNRKFVKTTKI